MRVVLLSLLLVVAACSAPAESADTTTTTTTPATSTTAEPTTATVATTTTEPECVERDRILYDSRGFVCPPNMKADQQAVPEAAGYRPGTYTTRIFEPRFSFTREVTFRSAGENTAVAELDIGGGGAFIVGLSPGFADQLQPYPFASHEWVKNLTSSSVDYWGYPGTQIDFETDTCPGEGQGCFVRGDNLPVPIWGWGQFQQVRLLFVDVPGGPIGFEIGAQASRFDQYWTEVAEPILASIEFTDS